MLTLNPDLLKRYDVPGPRYTSYPTADRFVDAFGLEQYLQALEQRKLGIGVHRLPLSLYIHLPFCASLCYYCACNKIITKQYDRALTYLQLLRLELDMTLTHLGRGQKVSQLHLGGGTPTFYRDEELRELMGMLKAGFNWNEQAEFSIEIDPRTINTARLSTLRELGFNRLSLGVQDFEPAVQKSVHRIQSTDSVESLLIEGRKLGFESTNFDLIYGLPMQTIETFNRTINEVIRLRPDRIALYAYAHLPQRFKSQRRIDSMDLPNAQLKVTMLDIGLKRLQEEGYVYIGMDHFALPTDDLSKAKRQGRLHRNFQGYTTQPDADLLALGVSAIGKVGATYSQNAKTIEEYQDLLSHGKLPIVKGLALTRDDLVRRAIIMGLMCQGMVHFEDIEQSHLLNFSKYFAEELKLLQIFQEEDMIDLTDQSIEVTDKGWFFVRAIAMVFDRYLQNDINLVKFSKII